ncbi:hypothetical protein HYU19_05630 [Candidatus Woesearchaeota archaeon]|nr:hypothetical protein [Candidatus Woesearchaeota archaeon]
MAVEPVSSFVIFPAISMGIVIGLVELAFVHSDEQGMGWLKHGLHAVIVAMVLVFISMNISFVSNLAGYPLEENFYVNLGVRILLGLVATVKVKAAAAIAGKASGIGEKMGHALVVGALISIAPYAWPFIEPVLPGFLKF